jgi:hypothetical protein
LHRALLSSKHRPWRFLTAEFSQIEMAAAADPLVGLLDAQGGHEPQAGRAVGEDADDAGPSFQFLGEPFEAVRGPNARLLGQREG